jgi:small GTP-binding protein
MTQYPVVVLLGNSGVGKTSIYTVFQKHEFRPELIQTIGMDRSLITRSLGGSLLTFMLKDTAGQEAFRSLTPLYLRDASAAILTFSLADNGSFKDVRIWNDILKETNDKSSVALVYLVGNKADCPRVIASEEGEELAKNLSDHGVTVRYFETSAKTGEGIEELVMAIMKDVSMAKPSGPALPLAPAGAATEPKACC